MKMTHRTLASLTLVLILCGSSGCRVTLPNSELPTESNAEMIEHIAYMPYVTSEAMLRSMYVLKHEEVFAGSYEELRSAMQADGVRIPDLAPNECPDRAELAMVFHEMCDVPAGLNYGLTGLGRYALRDLQYERIVRTGRDHGPMTGGEYLGLLARAEEHLRTTGQAQTIELGEEP